jgi:hypothetical protein
VPRKGRARRFREARKLKQGYDDGLFREGSGTLADVTDDEFDAYADEDDGVDEDDSDVSEDDFEDDDEEGDDWDPDRRLGR